jgi:hypothetical protein
MNLREVFQIDEFVDFQESDISQLRRVFKLHEEDEFRDYKPSTYEFRHGEECYPDDPVEFVIDVVSRCEKLYGDDFREKIEAYNGGTGAIDWFISEYWKKNYSVYETVSDIGMMYDLALGDLRGGNIELYPQFDLSDWHIGSVQIKQRRPSRPLSIRDTGYDHFYESVIREEDEFRDFKDQDHYTDFRNPLFDVFPKTYGEFFEKVNAAAEEIFGFDYVRQIDTWEGWSGATFWLIQQLWDAYYTAYEALFELGFVFDSALNGYDREMYPNTDIEQGVRTIKPKINIDFLARKR